MSNRIDSSDVQVNTSPRNVAPIVRPPMSAVQEVTPARSVYDLAHDEFPSISTTFIGAPLAVGSVSTGSVAETLENIGFAIGAKLHERRRASADGYTDRTIARSLLRRLISENNAVSAAELTSLQDRFPYDGKLDTTLDAMRESGMTAGERALLLCTMLHEGRLAGTERERGEEELNAILQQSEWALELFACLEFGRTRPGELAELRSLYQSASAKRKRLSEWFHEFRRLRDRSRKLKALIRALAFELSAQGPAMDVHLSAVVTDLKRILQFLGLEDHCERLARRLNMSDTDSDSLMETLLECVDQGWIGADWLTTRFHATARTESDRYRYAKGLMDLIKMMPNDCFDDASQRESLQNALAEYLEKIADAEF
jgi:type III secretion system YopN/LcrE/InvE/MxiC family regulator